MIEIRNEQPDDRPAIRVVHEVAFGQSDESNIVDALRLNYPQQVLSLVAVNNMKLVGHIMFSPVEIGTNKTLGMGLAPMAVLPEFQRQGIGSALVTEGLNRLEDQGCPVVIVLGHPNYYPRFGFEKASLHGLSSQWAGIPDEAFMVKFLTTARAERKDLRGVVTYKKEFAV